MSLSTKRLHAGDSFTPPLGSMACFGASSTCALTRDHEICDRSAGTKFKPGSLMAVDVRSHITFTALTGDPAAEPSALRALCKG
jgi:hypothetical protein